MNYKELLFSTIKGAATEVIPFVPRLDLWYKANKLNDTLPDKYKNAALMDITDDLNIGYHAVIPDFRDYSDDNGDIDLGLGIYRFKTIPYNVELHNVERKVTREKEIINVEYLTPYGSIHTKVLYSEIMKKSGATLAHVLEYAIKGVQDFEAVAYIYENIEIKPQYDHFLKFKESIGGRGIVAAFNSLCASPMHLIMKELMSVEAFFYESFDNPEELEWLAGKITGYYDKVFEVVANSPAEIVLSGANYDSSIISPLFFNKHIKTSLRRQAESLHKKDKYLITHTDGENRGLLEAYLESGFDIADSVCPAPMTSMSLKDVRDILGKRVTVWGGIPSISVLEDSMTDYEFDKYIDTTMESVGSGDHLIFSIADTTPPGAKFDRIKRIAKKVKEFGPVK